MLRTCPECSGSVSDSAAVCPHCGYRILGRENLVKCPHCGVDVLPEVNPHDTISKYCPLCKKPITQLGQRRCFLTLIIFIFIFVVLVVILGGVILLIV